MYVVRTTNNMVQRILIIPWIIFLDGIKKGYLKGYSILKRGYKLKLICHLSKRTKEICKFVLLHLQTKQVLEVGKPEATNETCFCFHRSLIKAAALFADCRCCLCMGLVHTFFDAAQISIIDLSHTRCGIHRSRAARIACVQCI